jgi:small subunit ribosomal protein SAe
MVDMYFYRDPEEQEKDQEEQIVEDRKAVTAGGDDEFATGAGDWDADTSAVTGIPAVATAAAGDWDAAGGEWAATGGNESWDAAAAASKSWDV